MKKSLISVLMAMTVMAAAAGCSQGGDSATAAAEAKNETETKAAEESTEAEADSQSEETDGEEAKGEGSTFTVGFDADFPPMGFKAEDGSYTGFDLDVYKRQIMNIKRAKEEIKNSIEAYLLKDEFGAYAIPSIRQRPVPVSYTHLRYPLWYCKDKRGRPHYRI